jgi:hypothetical protein
MLRISVRCVNRLTKNRLFSVTIYQLVKKKQVRATIEPFTALLSLSVTSFSAIPGYGQLRRGRKGWSGSEKDLQLLRLWQYDRKNGHV